PDLDALVAARPGRGLLLGVAEPDPTLEPMAPGLSGEPSGPLVNWPGNRQLRLSALPHSEGPDEDEPLGHALAALDARWVLLALPAVTGHEERVRRFARIFRALPASSSAVTSPLDRPRFGVTARTFPLGEQTYLALANDTPYPVRLDTLVGVPAAAVWEDLGPGLGV